MTRSSKTDEFSREPDLLRLSEAYELLRKEPCRARAMLEDLADKGSLMSMVCLAGVYLKGLDVSLDSRMAEKWLMRAADGGSRIAPHQLGLLHLDLKEYKSAEEMFRRGAEWNYLPSLYRLGIMYADGIGVPKQPVLAREFLERASSRGHVFARRRLAGLLLEGTDGPVGILRGLWLFGFGLFDAVAGAVSDPNGQRMRS